MIQFVKSKEKTKMITGRDMFDERKNNKILKGENMNKEFNQTEYVNEFIRKKYDRINLLIPAGNKEIIKRKAAQKGKSVNQYINELIDTDLNTNIDF